MENLEFVESGDKDYTFINNMIVEYNRIVAPFTQSKDFIGINRVVKNEKDEIVAGCNSYMYCWDTLYIDVLWVNEIYRKKGYGTLLLKEVEKIAIENGCKLIHLTTFDFQAREFYIKHGFEVYGTLEYKHVGFNCYSMKKEII